MTDVTINEPRFPMLDHGYIPWWLAKIAYASYVVQFGDDQSLERIAERGGFGWEEFGWLMQGCPKLTSPSSSRDTLMAIKAAWEKHKEDHH